MTDDTLTPERLAELERLCQEATQGPWRYGAGSRSALVTGPTGYLIAELERRYPTGYEHLATAQFIAAARTALPALLARVRALEARVGELSDVVQESLALVEPIDAAMMEESAWSRTVRRMRDALAATSGPGEQP